MQISTTCPFCTLSAAQIWLSTNHAAVFFDAYPLAEGHTLIIPRHHVASLFDLSQEEQGTIWDLVGTVRAALMAKYHPDGFNIGLNDGVAAGQTIGHAHIHVIPRHHGDVLDPRGGVRWIIPEKANYWNLKT